MKQVKENSFWFRCNFLIRNCMAKHADTQANKNYRLISISESQPLGMRFVARTRREDPRVGEKSRETSN